MAIIPTQNQYPDRAGYLGLDTDRNVLVGMSDGMFRSMNTPESWINVKDFGAKGDGVTDDTEAIQNALNKLQDGSTIYFPSGTYLTSETFPISYKIHMLGDGNEVSTIKFIGNKDKFLYQTRPIYGLSIENLKFVNEGTINTSFINFNNHLLASFRNLRIYEGNSPIGCSIIQDSFCYYSTFDNIRIAGDKNPLYISGANANVFLNVNVILNNDTNNDTIGIKSDSTYNRTIGSFFQLSVENLSGNVSGPAMKLSGMDSSTFFLREEGSGSSTGVDALDSFNNFFFLSYVAHGYINMENNSLFDQTIRSQFKINSYYASCVTPLIIKSNYSKADLYPQYEVTRIEGTNGDHLSISHGGIIRFNGKISSNKIETATIPANQTKRLPIYTSNGDLIGYIPIYTT